MINYTDKAIESFEFSVDTLYPRNQESQQNQSSVIHIIKNMGRISLSRFSQSDSLYFSLSHALSSAKIGLEILSAINYKFGGLREGMAINFMASVLFCNIGIIKGVLDDDQLESFKIGKNNFLDISQEGTDSELWIHKGYRSREFIETTPFLSTNTNIEALWSAIEYSEFMDTKNRIEPRVGIIDKYNRATQIITLMSSSNFHRTMTELFYSANEGGIIDQSLFENLGDFKEKWPQYFWDALYPDVAETILILRETDRGRNIVSSIYTHISSF